jgi:twitching motility two-component system response regulator PilH
MAKIEKIMVVDDSAVERKHVVSILQQANYTVIEAESGEEAIQMAMAHTPDLIFMDVMMPGVNGFQATRRLRKVPETANVKVIMLTSRTGEDDKSWATKQGADGFLTKPATSASVMAEINKLSD